MKTLIHLSTAGTSGIQLYKTNRQLSTQSYHQSVLPPTVSLQCLFSSGLWLPQTQWHQNPTAYCKVI